MAKQFSATQLHIALQNLIAVFGAPDQMHLQIMNRMTTRPLLFHSVKLTEMSSN
ncbi:hypothetical protein [Spirosoma telluris]|uniref:hypothetical protein n=1 Tax=Spirosoma telluris TaxID=2183553 RepID=UPI002FC2ED6A